MTADAEGPSPGPIDCERLGDGEPFHDGGEALGFGVLAFWRWSASDLVSNATRGVLDEYLVAQALGISNGCVREEWAECDLEAPDGALVEVKSAAYIQSRHQERLSRISFRVPKTCEWDRESNRQDDEPRRKADVYVFALLAHKDPGNAGPARRVAVAVLRFAHARARRAPAQPAFDHAATQQRAKRGNRLQDV